MILLCVSLAISALCVSGHLCPVWLWPSLSCVTLAIFALWMTLLDEKLPPKDRLLASLRYLYMGVLGGGLYYAILQALLWIQGKELDHYQGIDGLGGGFLSGGIPEALGGI